MTAVVGLPDAVLRHTQDDVLKTHRYNYSGQFVYFPTNASIVKYYAVLAVG